MNSIDFRYPSIELPSLECEVILEFGDEDSIIQLCEKYFFTRYYNNVFVINDCHGISIKIDDNSSSECSYTYYFFNHVNYSKIGNNIKECIKQEMNTNSITNRRINYSTIVECISYSNRDIIKSDSYTKQFKFKNANCLFTTSYKASYSLVKNLHFDFEFINKLLFERLEDLNHILLRDDNIT